jgi:hypothetical protein
LCIGIENIDKIVTSLAQSQQQILLKLAKKGLIVALILVMNHNALKPPTNVAQPYQACIYAITALQIIAANGAKTSVFFFFFC